MLVSELMTERVQSCGQHHTLEHAAGLMWNHNVGSLPVVDDNRRPIAMITDRDICMSALTQGRPLRDIQVHVAMSKHLSVCHPHEPIEAAERTLQERGLHRLPVVNEMGMLVGMISTTDIADSKTRALRDRPAAGQKPEEGARVSLPRLRSTERSRSSHRAM
jgi:CBS domain-containing protein